MTELANPFKNVSLKLKIIIVLKTLKIMINITYRSTNNCMILSQRGKKGGT